MTDHQKAWEVGSFSQRLRDVVALLDPGSGWYGIFCRSDPAGVRACLDGAEIPPWDVMESLFEDLAAVRGAAFVQRESVRAAESYFVSVAALAVELHRVGLDADWATLLWEASSLPPAELAAAADALAAAGRPDDYEQLLRQGVARPAAEITDAMAALDRAGRRRQAQALLGAFIRVRTPQDAARVAAGDPCRLVPQLLPRPARCPRRRSGMSSMRYGWPASRARPGAADPREAGEERRVRCS
ncbi:hypothetical protein [Streptomyces sp. NPDC056358]|uniref:hypothetical protein n=1 Tax=Streptomyces sp. NPDC056358 TaxID=3345794 RepID=UPI0035DBA7DF